MHVLEGNMDLGSVAQGAIASHSFQFSNRGRSPLALMQVEATCACTATLLTRQVMPGESGQITLRADTRGLAPRIPQRVAATVATNDPNAPSAEFVLTFVLEPEFEVSVPHFRFRHATMGAELESLIVATARSGVQVLKVTSTTRAVRAELIRPDEAGGAFRVRATLVDATETGLIGVIVVETSSPHVPIVRLPVTAEES